MSSNWRPDDSIYDRDENGMVNGVRMVRDAHRKHGIRLGKRVITSQDKGMREAQMDLRRASSPAGVKQWLVPITHCPKEDEREILWFVSELDPHAKVPTHAHRHAHFRIIFAGSVKYGDIELKAGDWMAVPAGVEYSLEAGPSGASFMYPHPMPPCDPDENE